MTAGIGGNGMSENPSSGDVEPGIDSIAIDVAIRLAILGLLIYWSLLLIGPFVTVVLWGVVLAVALYPIFAWLRGMSRSMLKS